MLKCVHQLQKPNPWSSICWYSMTMTDATNYFKKFLVSSVGNQWCLLFPNVFQATSYIKTTNGIIKKIHTVLELEGILEIAGVHFAEGHWSPESSTAPPSITEPGYGPARDKAYVYWHLVQACFYWISLLGPTMTPIYQRKKIPNSGTWFFKVC